MQDGKSSNVLAGFRTEQYADGRVVAFRAFQLIIHSYIHIHLSNVLMGDFGRLQVDQYEAFHQVIVEYQVYVVVLGIGDDVLLALYKGLAFAHLHQKLLKMGDDGTLQFAFRETHVTG